MSNRSPMTYEEFNAWVKRYQTNIDGATRLDLRSIAGEICKRAKLPVPPEIVAALDAACCAFVSPEAEHARRKKAEAENVRLRAELAEERERRREVDGFAAADRGRIQAAEEEIERLHGEIRELESDHD